MADGTCETTSTESRCRSDIRSDVARYHDEPSTDASARPPLAAKAGMPSVGWESAYAEAGGLMAYGASLRELHRDAAGYIARILKGAKPADLPVEQPTKFDLVINLKTAKQLGVTIPPSLLFRANRVIE
jgi:putative ABC transport system substrate-binding protein